MGAALLATAMLMFVVAGVAKSEPIDDGSASAGGWRVTAPGISGATLTPSVSASYPCDPKPTCEENQELLGVVVGDPLAPIASANVLFAEAQAFQQANATATLQTVMQGAANFTLPTQWNTRGYARVEGFSALNGQILADTLEAETVFGADASSKRVSASGVRVVNLRLAGLLSTETLAPILPGAPNQVLLDTGTVRIVYWETNWNPSNGSTTDGQPIWANALHITDSVTDADITLSLATTNATFPPVARDDTASTTPGNAVAVDVVFNDSDGDGDLDRSSVTVTSVPTNGTVTCDGAGVCTYTPNAGFEGTDSFTYRVCDSTGACDSATVTVTVASSGGGNTGGTTNSAPVAGDDSAATTTGAPVVVAVGANDTDPDGDRLTITGAAGTTAKGGIYSCSDTGCTYTPPADYVGTDTFTYEICDSSGACDRATVTVTVAANTGTGGDTGTGGTGGDTANQAPDAVDDTASTNGNSSVTIDVVTNDSDPDGNLVRRAQVTVQSTNGVVVCEEGSCTYTPNAGFSGSDSFQYQVCDLQNLCDTATVTVTVPAQNNTRGGENNPPVATDDRATTGEGTSVTIHVVPNDSDPDGNLVRDEIAITVPPQHGAVICNGGTCTYTPEPGYSGPDSFEYRVCDFQNLCDTATVHIIVGGDSAGADNEPPVALDDSVTARPGQPATINVVNNDGDPDGDLDVGTVTVTVPPAHGSVTCVQGKCIYTPEPGFFGSDSFQYRVCDKLGACTTATVTITVPSLNVGEGDGGEGDGGDPGEDGNGVDGGDGGDDAKGGTSGDRPRTTDSNDGEGEDSPGSGDDPALPGDTPPNAPISLDSPLLGAPNAPLPFTGGEPSFYVGAALNLLLLGMLLLLIERFARSSRMPQACPAWHNHEETHASKGCAYGEWS